MSDNIYLIAENNINAGQQENLKILLVEMIDSIRRDEPGTLNYEWFISDDGKSVTAYERYTNSEACIAHMGILGQKFGARLVACVAATKIVIYGNPSDKLREVFAPFPTFYMSLFEGFAR